MTLLLIVFFVSIIGYILIGIERIKEKELAERRLDKDEEDTNEVLETI